MMTDAPARANPSAVDPVMIALRPLEFDIHVISFQLLRRQQVRERVSLWKARKCWAS
jgi:hypothetical protein